MQRSLVALGLLLTALFAAPTTAATGAIPRSSGVIRVHGELVPYLSEGEGEPCIVTGLAPQYPPLFSDRLKNEIRFIYVDFENSWDADSTRDVSNVGMDDLVQEIDDVRLAFGLERACLVGHSSTGLVAIEYLARHPERVSRLILISVHPFWNKALVDAWKESWERDASPERKAALAENMKRMPDSTLKSLSPRDAFALRYIRNGPRLFYDPSYDFSWAWIGRQFSAPMLDRYWSAIVKDYDPWSRLANNATPIFVGLGRHDNAVPPQVWDRERRATPGLTFAMFEKSANFPMIEQPTAFDGALIDWITKTPSKSK